MSNFMAYIDEPGILRTDPEFRMTRRNLAELVRNTPASALDPEDSLDLDLIQNARARFVRILLLNSSDAIRDERQGIIDLELRAPFSHSQGKILTPQDLKEDATAQEDTLQMWLGEEWSTSLLERLPTSQRIMALRYAYSCRARKLDSNIRAGKPGMLEMGERLAVLEERCSSAIARVLRHREA